MKAIIDCIWCKDSFKVDASDITIIYRLEGNIWTPGRLYKTQCPKCKRVLQPHVPFNRSIEELFEELLRNGAKRECVSLSATDLHFFQKDLQREDFLSEIAEFECYA